MNVLFLAENPQLFLEYAVRLERRNIPFWTASTNNDFHKMMGQVKISVVFADYHFMDFKKFDVYKHISKNRDDLVFLFLNEPEGTGGLMVQWEDRIRQNFPEQWTDELERLLRIVSGQEMPEEFLCKPTRIQDLMRLTEGEGRAALHENMGDGLLGGAEQGEMEPNLHVDFQPDSKGTAFEPLVFENGSLGEFMELRKKYKVGYQEYMLMGLFFSRLNKLVELEHILKVLGIAQNKQGKNAAYQYVHRIRTTLEKMGKDEVQLIRIKKGCYSLVSVASE